MRRVVLLDDLPMREHQQAEVAPAPWDSEESAYRELHPREVPMVIRRLQLEGNHAYTWRVTFNPPYLTPTQTARILGVRRQTVENYLNTIDQAIKTANWGRHIGLRTQCIAEFGWRATLDALRLKRLSFDTDSHD